MTESKHQVLLEVGTEEIPARFILPALEQIRENLGNALKEERIEFSELKTHATPRRLAVIINDIAEKQKTQVIETRGPASRVAFSPEGEPTKAGLGFARSKGVDPKDLEKKEVNGQEYVFALQKDEGRPTRDCLAELFPRLISSLNFPKTMRWGDGEFRFARPIHWLVALFDDQIIPFTFAGQESGKNSRGHRFWGVEKIEINHPREYLKKLEEGYVLADYNRRREIIREKAEKIAEEMGGRPVYDEELLWEVTFLVEYPVPINGKFMEKFLQLPEEVLITSMQKHQRYFPVRNEEGLLPGFITFMSGPGGDKELVRFGNEKVLQARLDDAFFFFNEDSAIQLREHSRELARVVFMEGLGNMEEKAFRLQILQKELGGLLGWPEEMIKKGMEAASLCKADLVTQMVDEFPELQGIMGCNYALQEGIDPEIARAIAEHYQPRFKEDSLPETKLGRVLGLAEKLDNIAAAFYTGNIPSGSQDPLALRRQGLAAFKILNGLEVDIPLSALLEILELVYKEQDFELQDKLKDLEEFLKRRMARLMEEEGLRYDIVEAVIAGGDLKVQSGLDKGRALAEMRGDEQFILLVQSAVRAQNILKNRIPGEKFNTELLVETAEKNLWENLQEIQKEIINLEKEGSYKELFLVLARLAQPLEEFFDRVMVMAEEEDLKKNRLALLEKIRETLNRGVDLTQIVLD